MADVGDVAGTLVTLLAAALYPSGVAAGSPLGIGFRIYRGDPTAAVMDTDLRAGYTQTGGKYTLTNAACRIAHVTVNPRVGVGRLVPPYVFAPPTIGTIATSTLTATVSGNTVTLGGTITAGQGIALAVNGTLLGSTAGAGDTLATLATTLAGLVNAGTPATATGAVITVPASVTLIAAPFVSVTTSTEVERQIQGFQVTIYSSDWNLRDAVGSALTRCIAGTKKITLADGFQGLMRLSPPVSVDDDKPGKELLFVRKLYLQVEFPVTTTTVTSTLALALTQIETPAGTVLANVIEG